MSSEEVRSLTTSDPEWDQTLTNTPSDFYHSAAYHRLAEEMGEGKARLLVYRSADRFLAWPYLLCPIEGLELCDATSVYGYSGPVASNKDLDKNFCLAAWAAFRDVWRKQRVVSLFTRFHPLLANHELCSSMHGSAQPQGEEVLALGRSVSIDLQKTNKQQLSAYRKALRQEVKAAREAGMKVHVDSDWDRFDSFIELYDATMNHNQASTRYRFSANYIENLRKALGPSIHLFVAEKDQKIAAAMIVITHNAMAHAHLVGVNPAFQMYSPLKVLIDETRLQASDWGFSVLHLGAGRGGREDSLFTFKKRFSRNYHPFYLGRWVLDLPSYRKLVDGPACSSNGLFFPAYRAF